jgi:hypothetical protein
VDGRPPRGVPVGDPVVAGFLVGHRPMVPCRIQVLRPPGPVRGPLSVGSRPSDAWERAASGPVPSSG